MAPEKVSRVDSKNRPHPLLCVRTTLRCRPPKGFDGLSGTVGSCDQQREESSSTRRPPQDPARRFPVRGVPVIREVIPANGWPLMLIWEEQSLGGLLQFLNFGVQVDVGIAQEESRKHILGRKQTRSFVYQPDRVRTPHSSPMCDLRQQHGGR